MRNKKQNVVISVLMTLALLVSIPQKPMMAAEITSSTSVTTEPYTWQNAQIGGGGYVDDIIFNYGEKDLIYARTDMGEHIDGILLLVHGFR